MLQAYQWTLTEVYAVMFYITGLVRITKTVRVAAAFVQPNDKTVNVGLSCEVLYASIDQVIPILHQLQFLDRPTPDVAKPAIYEAAVRNQLYIVSQKKNEKTCNKPPGVY